MIDARTTKAKLEGFANLVEKRDPDTAAHLRDLGDALVDSPTADAWALSDIGTLLDPERISSALGNDGSSDLLARSLEVLRNSLVLLPLGITWFGIALAVDGYYKLINVHPELAGQSFIYLWQGGFQGRMLFPFPLGTLAVIDAFLLACVFLLTLAAYGRSAWVSIWNYQFGAKFSHALSQALIDAQLILAPRRSPQYASIRKFEQSAQDLMHEIAAERQRLVELAQRRERELGDLNGIADNLGNSSVVFLNAAQALANTHTATLAALNGASGTMKGLAATQQDVMKAVHYVTGNTEALLQQQQKASEQTNAQIRSLLDANGTRMDSLIAAHQSGLLRMAMEQQRAWQDVMAKINNLIEVERQGIEGLLNEQHRAVRGSVGQPEKLKETL